MKFTVFYRLSVVVWQAPRKYNVNRTLRPGITVTVTLGKGSWYCHSESEGYLGNVNLL